MKQTNEKMDNNNNHSVNQFIAAHELSSHLNVSVQTIYDWIRKSKIPYYRLNGTYRFRWGDIQSWIERNKYPCRPKHGEAKF